MKFLSNPLSKHTNSYGSGLKRSNSSSGMIVGGSTSNGHHPANTFGSYGNADGGIQKINETTTIMLQKEIENMNYSSNVSRNVLNISQNLEK